MADFFKITRPEIHPSTLKAFHAMRLEALALQEDVKELSSFKKIIYESGGQTRYDQLERDLHAKIDLLAKRREEIAENFPTRVVPLNKG